MKFFWILLFLTFLIIKSGKADEKTFFIKCKSLDESTILDFKINKDKEKENPLCLINPEIISKSKKTSTYEEGCLSLPGHFAEIERPAECKVKYLDYYGKKKEINASGLLSTCIQHEIDHMNGVLFIDYLSKLKRDMIVKKLVKQKKELNKIVI